MKAIVRDYAIAVGLYLVIVVAGLVATLTLFSAIGYLPYSDRPGPGWYGPSFSLSQIGYYLSWSVLLLLPCLLWGTAVFAFLRVLRLIGAPTIILRVLGGLTAGLLALVTAAGAGWYIAMAAFPVWVAGTLGVAWGAALLPRYLGPEPAGHPGPARWALIGVLVVGASGALYWVFVPGYSQQLEVNIVRVTPSANELMTEPWEKRLKPEEASFLQSIIPRGRLHSGMSGGAGAGPSETRARMLVVVTDRLGSEARLRVPRGGSVVYVQQGDTWLMYPPTAPTLGQTIRLGPGARPGEATFAWSASDEASTFTWYPPIE